jgi:hypothetical protein
MIPGSLAPALWLMKEPRELSRAPSAGQAKGLPKIKAARQAALNCSSMFASNAATGDPSDPAPSSLCASPSFPASTASIWSVDRVSGRR